MQAIPVIVLGYILGSIPMGYIVVKLFKRQDITQIGSGRTGGTNAMRAGGVPLGILTGALDLSKGYLAVWIARSLFPSDIWVQVLAGVAAVLGHNWSIILFLLSKKFSAGAGTGPNVGAAMAFWPFIGLVAVPVVAFFVFIIGYASLASIFTGLVIIFVFTFMFFYQHSPWQYTIYGLMTLILVVYALRPNIKRLLDGTERRVGIFAKKRENVNRA